MEDFFPSRHSKKFEFKCDLVDGPVVIVHTYTSYDCTTGEELFPFNPDIITCEPFYIHVAFGIGDLEVTE